MNVPCVAKSNHIHVNDIRLSFCGPGLVFQSSKRLRLQEFIDKEHVKVLRLLALRADHLNPQDHNASGWIKSMKNPYYHNGIRNRELPDCSTVAQPTAPSHSAIHVNILVYSKCIK